MEAIEHLKETLWETPDSYCGHNPVGEYCIYGRSRDSSILENSNYDLILEQLEELAPDHCYDFRAHHWAVGWVETIMLKPDAPNEALQAAGEILCSLADYPCLDDGAYSERQCSELQDYWQRCSIKERVEYCQESGDSVFSARRDAVPEFVFDELIQSEMFY